MPEFIPFEAFTRFETTPYRPDPDLKIAEGSIRIRQREYSRKIQEILISAAFEGENVMRNLAPKNTGDLSKSIRVFPNTLQTGGVLPFTKGGSGLGVGPGGQLSFGPGGATRKIEVRIGEGVPYAEAVIGGSRKVEPEEGRYVVFSPYTIGAKSIVFKKNREKLYPDQVGVKYGSKNEKQGVLIFSSRSRINANDRFITEGVKAANSFVRRRINKLN